MKTNPFNTVNIPFPMMSRENIITIENTLEDEQLIEFYRGFHKYVLTGVEPTFSSRVLNGVWLSTKETLDRKAQAYVNQVSAGKNNLNKATEERKQQKKEKEVIENIKAEIESPTVDPEEVPHNIVEMISENPLLVKTIFDSSSVLPNEVKIGRWYSLCEKFSVDPCDENWQIAYNYYNHSK